MDASFEAKTYAKVDRRLIPFLFLCYILAYLDRVNVGFAKLQMLKDLSLSDAAFATGAGIFFIGYFFFEVPSNILLKRFGARTWIARIMISWGVISAAMIFVRNEWTFYGLRFLLGLAEAGFFPGIIFYLTLWYPSRLRSTRTALFVSAIAVSGVLGNPISGLIMDTLSGKMGLAGWQWLFLAEGIPSIVVGIWVYFYLDSGIAEAKWLTDEEKALLAQNIEAEDRHKHEVRVSDAFKSGKVWVLCAIYFTLMIGLYGISFWLPTIVKAFGVQGYLSVGLITAIPYAVAVVGMILLSRHSDRTGERRMHYVLNVTAGGLGLILSGVFAESPDPGHGLSLRRNARRHRLDAPLLADSLRLSGRHGGRRGHRHGQFHRQSGRLRRTECPGMGEAYLGRSLRRPLRHRGRTLPRRDSDVPVHSEGPHRSTRKP